MSGTQLEFGERIGGSKAVDKPEPCPTRCPRCGQHFSPDGRFCPFDGEPLVPETDWDPNGDPLLDRTVDGRYRIEAVIGEGGMGTVYRVRHVLLDKSFAMKALRADLANDPDIADRFIHEARVMASVSHPGLVQISDFGRLPSGQTYFVMELLGGASLRAILRAAGALAPERARDIARKIAEPMSAAHAVGIVHRDLKPDNVHVRSSDTGDEVKILDFGLAKVLGGSKVTRDGIIFGTPHYISPEQAAGEAPDQRADIYALGIVFYEMLTGRVPFEADSYMGVLTQHIYMTPRPPSELLDGSAELGQLEAIVLRCLEKKPERRFACMEEFVLALDEVPARLSPGPAVVSGLSVRPNRAPWADAAGDSRSLERPRPRRTLPVSIALGVLVASSLGAWVIARALRAPSQLPSPARIERSSLTSLQTLHELPASGVSAWTGPSGLAALTAEGAGPARAPASARPLAGTSPKLPAKGAPAPQSFKPRPSLDIIDPWAKRGR